MQMSIQSQQEQKTEEASEETKKLEEEKKAFAEDGGYCSSGLESDNDLDLLVEQEALRNQRMRSKARKFAEMGEVAKDGKE